MNFARPRSHFPSSKSAFSVLFIARHRAAAILLVRAIAGGALLSGIATASRVMYRLYWQTDGVIAAVFVMGWVVCLEIGMVGR